MARSRESQDLVKMAATVSVKIVKFSTIFTLIILNSLTSLSWCVADVLDETASKIDICHMKSCHPVTMNQTSVIYDNCMKNNYTISDRCCHDANGTVFGLDLSVCSLKSIPALVDISHSEWIALEDNPLVFSDENSTHYEAFRSLNNIQYLSLPGHFLCPGGQEAWKETTEGKGVTVCRIEQDVCIADNSTYQCPDDSHCVHDGPGLIQCQCNGDLYGYRCLRSGHFPMGLYYGVLCGCTVFICAFLWLTQRRKAVCISIKVD
ncbi:all-trans retinoic acid-induced differentiation factor-like [Lineus longissimus]|uniref:all-trans retinoic acid-induced differentiation factor-like n=1 Tax=Lineus longissimus TaxID=88925 RepID=UPI002B4DF79D